MVNEILLRQIKTPLLSGCLVLTSLFIGVKKGVTRGYQSLNKSAATTHGPSGSTSFLFLWVAGFSQVVARLWRWHII